MARGVGVVVSIFMVPLTLGYLGQERYGMWLTITSVVALLSFSDLGIGNGLVNALAEADGHGDRETARQYVSSALAALVVIAGILGAIFFVLYPSVEWGALFNVETSQAAAEAGPAIAVLTTCFLVALPLSCVGKVRAGLQEGFIDSSWAIAGSVLALVAVLLFITGGFSLPWLAFGMAGTPLIALLANGLSLFWREHTWLRVSIGSITYRAARRVLGVGAFFFLLQAAAAIAYQSDSIIVARIMGSASVPQYAVPVKLFLVVPMLLGFVLNPMWPAYREALARGDHDWIRTAFWRSIALSLVVSVPLATVLTLFGRPIINLWVGDGIEAAPLLMVGLGAWSILSALGGAVSTLLNALGVLRPQVILALFMVAANVALSIWLTRMIGVSGVVYGSLASQAAFVVFPVFFLVRHELRRLASAPTGEVAPR